MALWGGNALAFLVLGIVAIVHLDEVVMGCLILVFALWAAGMFLRSRHLSAAPEIPLSAVQRVQSREPRPPVFRGHFAIHFVEGGRPRRRLVVVDQSLIGAAAAHQRARRVLEAAGLLKAAR